MAGDPAQDIPGQTVQHSVRLEYTDDKGDSVPSRIYMQADGSRGFNPDTDFARPDRAVRQNRRRPGIQ